ncbi:MAG: hypothetical protein CVV44_17240 [Spirochaetae bacterium HGW-Spirochaetae-1]|nr:MAG: hypothetical protein CVV44_17240 [Spirochaetae bacterium HGW-Spirochaetae-1]
MLQEKNVMIRAGHLKIVKKVLKGVTTNASVNVLISMQTSLKKPLPIIQKRLTQLRMKKVTNDFIFSGISAI